MLFVSESVRQTTNNSLIRVRVCYFYHILLDLTDSNPKLCPRRLGWRGRTSYSHWSSRRIAEISEAELWIELIQVIVIVRTRGNPTWANPLVESMCHHAGKNNPQPTSCRIKCLSKLPKAGSVGILSVCNDDDVDSRFHLSPVVSCTWFTGCNL